jgi:ATP-dependent DNA ligase
MPFENLPIKPPVEPMEARSVARIPHGPEWVYEPKWDGFRCVAFRDGDDVALQSKSGQPLERYFPEIVDSIVSLPVNRFVLDGEIAIELDGRLDFDALLQRIHPAASRVRKLSVETPAAYYVFDLLVDEGKPIFDRRLEERRQQLQHFAEVNFRRGERIVLSPATRDEHEAEQWLSGGSKWFDGVIAKRAAAPYRFGERDAVVKIKRVYTADCVVGGFRLSKDGKTVASLLLGLYDDEGLLHLVGFVGAMNAAERKRAAELLDPIVGEPGFTGARPGGVSRWGSRDSAWYPVKSQVVVEVQFDHVTGSRFRHGARFVRWRPDKSPSQCTMSQLLAAR